MEYGATLSLYLILPTLSLDLSLEQIRQAPARHGISSAACSACEGLSLAGLLFLWKLGEVFLAVTCSGSQFLELAVDMLSSQISSGFIIVKGSEVIIWALSVLMRSCPSLSCNQENFVGFTTYGGLEEARWVVYGLLGGPRCISSLRTSFHGFHSSCILACYRLDCLEASSIDLSPLTLEAGLHILVTELWFSKVANGEAVIGYLLLGVSFGLGHFLGPLGSLVVVSLTFHVGVETSLDGSGGASTPIFCRFRRRQ
ncbi:hypothetical protein Bca101_020001 [Brassica carinata]